MTDRTEAEIRNAALEEAALLMEATGKRIAASDIRAMKSAPAAPTDEQCKEAAAIARSFGAPDMAAALDEDSAKGAGDDGLTAKQAWWAGYRAGKGLPPDMPRQDAVTATLRCSKCGDQANVSISSTKLVTHRPDGTPRDERDIASDPEGKLMHNPAAPLLAYRQQRGGDMDERAVVGTPRYKAWLHLRTHGQWPDDIPEWAKDHNGHMNDMTAARAVIEELAAALSATKGKSNG